MLTRLATLALVLVVVLAAAACVWAIGAGRQEVATRLGFAALLAFLALWLAVLHARLGPER